MSDQPEDENQQPQPGDQAEEEVTILEEPEEAEEQPQQQEEGRRRRRGSWIRHVVSAALAAYALGGTEKITGHRERESFGGLFGDDYSWVEEAYSSGGRETGRILAGLLALYLERDTLRQAYNALFGGDEDEGSLAQVYDTITRLFRRGRQAGEREQPREGEPGQEYTRDDRQTRERTLGDTQQQTEGRRYHPTFRDEDNAVTSIILHYEDGTKRTIRRPSRRAKDGTYNPTIDNADDLRYLEVIRADNTRERFGVIYDEERGRHERIPITVIIGAGLIGLASLGMLTVSTTGRITGSPSLNIGLSIFFVIGAAIVYFLYRKGKKK